MYELSREKAITHGYWTGDPGDDLETASDPLYGCDEAGDLPPAEELVSDPVGPALGSFGDLEGEREAGIVINDDEEIMKVREILVEMDHFAEDGNSGIDVYCEAVLRVSAYFFNDNNEN